MSKLRELIREVHRRSLWQVLGVYLAGSWLALQVVEQLVEAAGLPDWVRPFSLVLLVLGLPIVLATAIVQEGLGQGVESRASTPPDHEQDEGVEGEAAAAPATPAAAGSGGTRAAQHALFTWRNAILGGVAAFALLGLLTAGWLVSRSLGVGPAATLVAKGVLAERERILLADLQDRAADSLLAATLTEALRIDLAQSEVVRLVEPSFVAEGLERMGRAPDAPLTTELARELAVREGIKAALTGEIGRAGNAYVLTARLLLPETGEMVASVRETADGPDDVVDAVDRASRKLRERIGESLREIRAEPPLARVTTGDLEALRWYTEAERAITVEGEVERGLALLEEALARDSAFAMAWRKIGIVLSNRGEERARMRRALTRAYEHRDRLTEVERYLAAAAYYGNVEGDLDREMAAYENLLEIRPDHSTALNNQAVNFNDLREHRKAEEYAARALQVSDSSFQLPFVNLAAALANQGRHGEAMEVIQRFRAVYPGVPQPLMFEVFLRAAAGEYEVADSLLRELEAETAEDLELQAFAAAARSRVAGVQGLVEEAEQRGREDAAVQDRRGLPGEALEAVLAVAELDLEVRERPEEALRRVEAALERWPLSAVPPLDRPYPQLASLYARAGRPDLARRTLAKQVVEADTSAFLPADRIARTLTEGELLLAEGRAREAVERFRAADAGRCRLCALPGLARAYEAAGQPDSAAAAHEEYVERPGFGRMWMDGAFLGPTYERLGRLHEEAGNLEKARLYYAKFTELWADADPELQPRVEAARVRLEALLEAAG